MQCNHSTTVSAEGTEPVVQNGEELVRASGVPADPLHAPAEHDRRRPLGLVDARVAGDISDPGGAYAGLHIDVNGGIVTVIP